MFAFGCSCFYPLQMHGSREGDIDSGNPSIVKDLLITAIWCCICGPLDLLDKCFRLCQCSTADSDDLCTYIVLLAHQSPQGPALLSYVACIRRTFMTNSENFTDYLKEKAIHRGE